MSELLIILAFVLATIGAFKYGRTYGAESMARYISEIAQEKYPDFKKTIAYAMLDNLNKRRVEAGLPVMKIVEKE